MKSRYESHREAVFCPVCKSLIGHREIDYISILHCDDCKATYTYRPFASKPHAELDKKKIDRCDCGNC